MRSILWLLILASFFAGCQNGDSANNMVVTDGGREVVYEVPKYPWLQEYSKADNLLQRFPAPDGFTRIELQPGSFAHWLRGLPLKPGNPPVHYYDGREVDYQRGHAAVIDLDLSNRDLQQCADAIIRLRGEYLWQQGKAQEVGFRFTSGDLSTFSEWAEGMRPIVSGSSVGWEKRAQPDTSYRSFRDYLESIFMYAGTLSLQRDLNKIKRSEARSGDVIIQGGSPGHGVLILDVAEDANGKKMMLLAQSYMPAQDMHVLKNLGEPNLGSWFPLDFHVVLKTPLWVFNENDFYRFEP